MQASLDDRLLFRPRVDAALAAAFAAPVAVLSAPLGYGKTVAVGANLGGRADVAWYRAAGWHAGAFIAQLIDAVAKVRPGFGEATRALGEHRSDGETLALQFLEDLRHVNEGLTIVIDDAQELDRDAAFNSCLGVLAARLAPPVHLVILSRTMPAIDLAALTMTGRIALVTIDTLRFSYEEVAALAAARKRPDTAADVALIFEKTSGWPAALSLMFDPASDARALVSPEQLAERIVASFTSELRAVLEEAAIDPTLQVDQATAKLIARHAIADVSPDDRVTIDPLIASVLLARVDADGERACALHARAGARAVAAARWREALHHYELADASSFADFLARYPDEVIGLGVGAGLAARLARLPVEAASAAAISYLRALIAQQRGTGDTAAHLDEAERLVAADDTALQFALVSKRVEMQLGRGEPAALDLLPRLDALASRLGRQAQTRAALLSGWLLVISGDLAAAAKIAATISDVAEIKIARDNAVLQAYLQTVLGHHAVAQETLDAMLARLEAEDQLVFQARTLVWYARLALMWGDTTASLDAANEAVRRGGFLHIETEFAPLYATRGEAASHHGDATLTLESAAVAARHARGAWYAVDERRVPAQADLLTARGLFLGEQVAAASTLARSVAHRGDGSAALRLLAKAEAALYALVLGEMSPDPSEPYRCPDIVDAVDALAASAAHELSDFMRSLRGEYTPRCEYGAWQAFITSRTSAVDLGAIGEAVARFRDLDARSADEARNIAALLDLRCRSGPRFEVLLVIAAARAVVAGDARKIRQLDDALTPLGRIFTNGSLFFRHRRAAVPEIDRLTEREHEILVNLVQGLTNKEMAQRLVVSPRTVESHVERVLAKLEVATRARAIAKAIRLGLVTVEEIP